MIVRTRMAPSPTGFMHIGTLRTVLWDYYLARQNGGQFIIRIEDTDQERNVPGAVEALLQSMQKMGIDWDEGPILNADGTLGEKGDFGPYTQTHRLEIYTKYADQLLAAGHAYHCFCTAERLTAMREQQQASKQSPKYDRQCYKLAPEEIQARLATLKPGDSHVIRMLIPEGISEFVDAIRGKVSFNNADVDDQVIVKSNGIPTYHLAVVIDDYLMKISHVLRGEEWLSSTPKQIILHKMLDLPMPIYAHVPLLLNPDKTKLSKRKGDVSVESYLEQGYLPEALKNFLGTLGFNPTGDREIYTEQELVESFKLEKVNRAGAGVNREKLDWINGLYLKELSVDDFIARLSKFLGRELSSTEIKLSQIERARANTLVQVGEGLAHGIDLPDYEGQIIVWKKSDAAEAVKMLQAIKSIIPALDFSSVTTIEEKIKAFITENAWQNGNVLWPTRIALSGKEKSPSPFELLWVLGADESQKRLDIALQKLADLV